MTKEIPKETRSECYLRMSKETGSSILARHYRKQAYLWSRIEEFENAKDGNDEN